MPPNGLLNLTGPMYGAVLGVMRCVLQYLLAGVLLFGCDTGPQTSKLPVIFQNTIPTKLADDLELVGLEDRCQGCKPWRLIDFYSNESDEPIRQEKVSVSAGYRAMFAYPGTNYFSNTKVEQSVAGAFETDKSIIVEALKHEFERRKMRVSGFIESNPDYTDKMAPHRAANKDYLSFEQAKVNGFEYYSIIENVIGLLSNTISEVVIIVPQCDIIITSYLLRQENSKFGDIEEFLALTLPLKLNHLLDGKSIVKLKPPAPQISGAAPYQSSCVAFLRCSVYAKS